MKATPTNAAIRRAILVRIPRIKKRTLAEVYDFVREHVHDDDARNFAAAWVALWSLGLSQCDAEILVHDIMDDIAAVTE